MSTRSHICRFAPARGAASLLPSARRLLVALVLLGQVALVPSAAGGSLARYALIIGNNRGRAARTSLPPLQHAERDARRLRDALLRLANFDTSRVKLVLGAGRERILAAARELAARAARDRARLGQSSTLFAFFYTGHGLTGQLLTADAPLSGADLSRIFQKMRASVTLGVFDACYSGSLGLHTLRAKGIRATPGFNAFEALPTEMLDASGTLWFVSSQPHEVSYEDRRLGGVFTHFFLEGMRRASSDELGVTIQDIWAYAATRTRHYTARAGRPQNPQQIIRSLTSTGPLYFSFPRRRSARLRFAAGLAGRFLVRYDKGQLVEAVHKERGRPLEVPVYATGLHVERADGSRWSQTLAPRPGAELTVRPGAGWRPARLLGARDVQLRSKGALLVTERRAAWSGLLHLGYQARVAPEQSGTVPNRASLGLRLDRGVAFANLEGSYGRRAERYPAWGFTLDQAQVGLHLGAALDVWRLRLGLAATTGGTLAGLRYDDGASSNMAGFELGAEASAVLRLPLRLALMVRAGVEGTRQPPVAPPGAAARWAPGFHCGLAVGALVF